MDVIMDILDGYDENMISSSVVEGLLQHVEDQPYCYYYDEDFVVLFEKRHYMDSAN